MKRDFKYVDQINKKERQLPKQEMVIDTKWWDL